MRACHISWVFKAHHHDMVALVSCFSCGLAVDKPELLLLAVLRTVAEIVPWTNVVPGIIVTSALGDTTRRR